MRFLAAAAVATLAWPDVTALLARAGEAAQRFAPKAVLVELRVSIEDADPRPVFGFFDGQSEEANDLLVDVLVRGGPPAVRLLREPKRDRRPAALDLSRVAVSWTALRFAPGETPLKWEPLRLRARSDGTPCWRARLKEAGPVYFDASTGDRSAPCREPFTAP